MSSSDRRKPDDHTGSASQQAAKTEHCLGRWPVHVVLLPLFFMLSFYVTNILEFSFSDMAVPTAKAIGAALVLWGILALAMRNIRKGAAVVAVATVLFFMRKHIINLIPDFELPILGMVVNRFALVITLLAGACIVFALFVAKSKRSWSVPTSLINALAICVTAVAGFQAVSLNLSSGNVDVSLSAADSSAVTAVQGGQALPNIYHIVADAYARNDVLKEWFGYDNQPFLDWLAEKGFFVADKARVNYAHTHLSLSSTLNMSYFSFPQNRSNEANMSALRHLFYSNRVCEKLHNLGYKIICYPSGYSMTAKINNATYPHDEWMDEFERSVFMQGGEQEFNAHRRRILYALDHIGDPCETEGPVFVFSHMLCPHPPFVFTETGEPRKVKAPYQHSGGSHWYLTGEGTVEDYRQQYLGQLKFMNSKLRGTIEAILANSSRPAIIIFQGDHGPNSMLDWDSVYNTNMHEKLTTTIAYYFPDQQYDLLYDEITPVNSYRVIFNQYFGESNRMLEERSYFSASRTPFYFVDVTERAESLEGTERSPNPSIGLGPPSGRHALTR